MKHISWYITKEEATRSATAVRLGISNEPTIDQLIAMQVVARHCFDPVRKYFGRAIRVTSFFRSAKLNRAVGGSPTSQHSKGEAIDMQALRPTKGFTNADIFHYIRENLEFDQLIWEYGTDQQPDWVHVSYSVKGNRRQILRIGHKNGAKITVPYREVL